jgi:peroxin-13
MYGNSMLGGMGNYGGYGGYGGYNPMGGYGGISDPNDPNSLSRRMETGTQGTAAVTLNRVLMVATFQIVESIVGAFGGFAQMLDSTFMATYSSFFGILHVRWD